MATETTVMGTPLTEATADPELARLIRRHQQVNNSFFNGDPSLDSWVQDGDSTLHGGFDISVRGWDAMQKGLTYAAGRLSEGRMTFTPLGGRIVGDLAYLAGVEEGTVRLDGGDRQPMKLRVTSVFERIAGEWRCVHRHGEMTH